MVGDTIGRPWQPTCFSLRTGELLTAPALNAVFCGQVEEREGDQILVDAQRSAPAKRGASRLSTVTARKSVLVGEVGAARQPAAVTVRRGGTGDRKRY